MPAALGSLTVEIELNDDGFTTKVTRVGEGLKQVEQRMLATITAAGRLDTAVKSSGSSFTSWTIAIGQAENALHNLNDLALGWVESLVRVNREIENTSALLRGLWKEADGGDAMTAAKNGIQGLLNMASSSPFGFDALKDTFIKLKTAGIDPLNGSMKALTDGIAAFGGDDQRLTRAGYALQEMAGRGVISLQNLRRQLGQDIPGAVELMARSMNLTVASLDEIVQKGTLESGNAINQLLGEFDRTYGGAAVARMNTFTGAVAQLNVAFQKLAITAGGMSEGTGPGDSFYKTLTGGVKELADALQTPQFQAFAVTINQTLNEAIKGFIALGEAIVKWGDVLGSVGAHAIEFLVIMKAMQLVGSINLVSILDGLGAIAGRIGMIASIAGRVGDVLKGFAAPAVEAFLGMNRAILGASAGLTGFSALAVEAVAPMGALAASLGVLALPVAAVAGITLLVMHMQNLRDTAYEAGNAIKRLSSGDITEPNEQAARGEVDNLQKKLDELLHQQELLEKLKPGISSGQISAGDLKDITGFMGNLGFKAPVDFTAPDPEAPVGSTGGFTVAMDRVNAAGDRLKELIKNIRTEISSATTNLGDVASKRLANDAEKKFREIMTQIAQATQAQSESPYATGEAKLEQQRKNLERDAPGDTAGKEALNAQNAALVKQRYDSELAVIQGFIQQTIALQISAANSQNQIDTDLYQHLKEQLQDYYKQRYDFASNQEQNAGKVVTNDGAKEFEKAMKAAETAIEQMRVRSAELQAQLDGTNPVIAKLNELLSNTGKLHLISTDEIAKAREAATTLGELEDQVKKLTAANKAAATVTGDLDRQRTIYQGLINTIDDPKLPEAQRSFIALQAQMKLQLDLIGAAAGGMGMQFWNAAHQVQDALKFAEANATLGQIKSLIEQGDRARVQALPPSQRAGEQKSQLANQVDGLRASLVKLHEQKTISDQDFEHLSANLSSAQTNITTGFDATSARAGAREARPGETAVTDLQAKLAGLKSEMQGVNKTYDEWLVRVQRPEYAAHRAQILQLASAVTLYEAALKKQRVAEEATNTLASNADQIKDKLNLLRAIDTETAKRGKLSDIEKQILAYRLAQDKEVNKIAGQTPTDAKGSTDIAAEVAGARASADSNTNINAVVLLSEKMAELRTETLQLKISTKDGLLGGDRKAEIKLLDDEKRSLDDMIALYEKDGAKRKQMEDDVDAYILAKRAELNKKTQDFLMKTAEQWDDLLGNTEKFGEQAFQKIGDELGTMLEGGKVKWTDFTNWAIKEVTRLVLDKGMATLLKLADNGLMGTGGGGGGLLDMISGLFGGGGGASASSLVSGGTIMSVYGHSGGIIGKGEASFARSLPAHLFAGAPRFHSGIGPGELPAVIKSDEGVFTPGQMAAIGNLNQTSAMMASAVSSIASSLSKQTMPAGATGMSGPAVTLNLHNQSGTQLNAVSAQPQFDGTQWVLDTVIKAAQQPGQLRNAIRSTTGTG